MVVTVCCREGKSHRTEKRLLDVARRRPSARGNTDGGGLDWALVGQRLGPGLDTVPSSSVMHSSSHQGAVATWNPGRRDPLGPASLQIDVGSGQGLGGRGDGPLQRLLPGGEGRSHVKGAGMKFRKDRGRNPCLWGGRGQMSNSQSCLACSFPLVGLCRCRWGLFNPVLPMVMRFVFWTLIFSTLIT